MNFDVRDRARMIGTLLVGAIPSLHEDDEGQEAPGGVVLRREQVKLVLFEGKLGLTQEKDAIRECSISPVSATLPSN
jgi:AP-3 complex subunit beta